MGCVALEPRAALADSLALGDSVSAFQVYRPRAVRPPEFGLGTAEFDDS